MSMFADPIKPLRNLDGTGVVANVEGFRGPGGNATAIDPDTGNPAQGDGYAASQTAMQAGGAAANAGMDVDVVQSSMTPTGALSQNELRDIILDLEQQPTWRRTADREMDYVDGNQLDSDLLRRQQEIGMPPAIEPLIGPAIAQVTGLEKKTRADWKVTPNSEFTDPMMATAMGFELNQAEKKSKADSACSAAFKSQVSVGIGWVEVSRCSNPFEYQYRSTYIPRNEIWWDWLAVEPDLKDARYLVRRRWTDSPQVALMFPQYADLVTQVCNGWSNWQPLEGLDGGDTTGLSRHWHDQNTWTIEEMQWRQNNGRRVCLFEVWYRRWVRVAVLKSPDGRVVEYDDSNPSHVAAVVSGALQPQSVVIPKMRRGIWLGPHCLDDGPTPYPHQRFPYVPFWGSREDRTMRPYGLVRGMMYSQDSVNATISKLRWGLAAVRVTRTAGAVIANDAQFRREVARPDADIKLDAAAMAKQGAVFKVERDFQLSDQQFKLMEDSRAAINRVSNIMPPASGGAGGAQSGVQESTQIEQSTQGLADYVDNFNTSRSAVGELLLSLIVEDLIGQQKTIAVKGDGIKPDVNVQINQPTTDPLTGQTYLNNDVERAMLKVEINEVPSTSSYRAQQLSSLSEAFKAMPPNFQAITMPYLIQFMDLPADIRQDLIQKINAAATQPTPEQIQQQIAQAVQDALQKSGDALKQSALDLKKQELDAKYPDGGQHTLDQAAAQLALTNAQTFSTTTDALYASNQTAAAIAADPAIAPIADEVARLAGNVPPIPVGVDPGFAQANGQPVGMPTVTTPAPPTPPGVVTPGAAPMAATSPAPTVTQPLLQPAAVQPVTQGMPPAHRPAVVVHHLPPPGSRAKAKVTIHQNSDPVFPAKPASPHIGQHGGIETMRTTDNLPGKV